MKLRIRADSLRLRLTRGEIEALRVDGRVAESICFGPAQQLEYALALADVDAPAASYRGDRVEVVVPRERGLAWASSDEVGIYAEQTLAEGALRLIIEKDFRCLAPREGEDDGDAFPNPAAADGGRC